MPAARRTEAANSPSSARRALLASVAVRLAVSRAHAVFCSSRRGSALVKHALFCMHWPLNPVPQRCVGKNAATQARLSRAGLPTVVGALQGVERAPVRSLRKKMTLGAVNESGWDPATRPRKNALVATTAAGAGPRRRFLRGARRLSARAGRGTAAPSRDCHLGIFLEVDDTVASEHANARAATGKDDN